MTDYPCRMCGVFDPPAERRRIVAWVEWLAEDVHQDGPAASLAQRMVDVDDLLEAIAGGKETGT